MRRYARAGDVEDLLAAARDGRPGVLDDFEPYLDHRWGDGCTSATALFAEVRAPGCRRGYGTVRRWPCAFRTPGAAAPPAGRAPPQPPKACDVAGWVLRHPDRLGAGEQLERKDVLARRRHLDASARRVALANGLTSAHGSGAVEGNADRVETLKRQTYSRASFDLLRERVLLTA